MSSITVTLMFENVRTTVRGEYTPEEKPCYSPECPHPGSPEDFEVTEVYAFGSCMNMAEWIGEDRCRDIAQAVLKREGLCG